MTDLEYFENLCEMDDGEPDVAYKIGLCYFEGKGVEKNEEEAMLYINYSAGLRYEKALKFIDSVTGHKVIQKDLSSLKQEEINKLAFEKNNYEALMMCLDEALNKGYEALAEKVLVAVRNNNSYFLGGKFEYLLGMCYEMGFGTEKDLKKAIRCYLNSSDCDDYPAVNEKLYNIYYKGTGVQPDIKRALKFKEKYAKKGSSEDKYLVSLNYLKGQNGFIKDEHMSMHWAGLAIRQLIIETEVEMDGDFDVYNVNTIIPILVKTYRVNRKLSFQLIKRFCRKQDIASSLELSVIYAENGFKEIQYNLGMMYLISDSNSDKETGFYWLKKSAEKGYGKALEKLALCYFYGEGTDVNYQEFNRITSESDLCSDEISLCRAISYMYGYFNGNEKRDLNTAIKMLKELSCKGYEEADRYLNLDFMKDFSDLVESANNGNAESQLQLAKMYLEGKDVSEDTVKGSSYMIKAALNGSKEALLIVFQNYNLFESNTYCNESTAFKIYKRSAEYGFRGSEYMLGRCYEKGFGTEVFMEIAVEWYTRGANQECPDCCYSLGECYRKGIGVCPNMEKALNYYNMAAKLNHIDATMILEDPDIKNVDILFKRIAEGHVDALTKLGQKYLYGHIVEKDPPKAMRYFVKAAEKGDAEAAFLIATCYESANGVSGDKLRAFEWFEKAAELGNVIASRKISEPEYIKIKITKNMVDKGKPEGVFKVAYDYFCGENGEVDYKRAFELFLLAADKKYPLAMYYCGKCYECGLGTEADITKAVEYYAEAANRNIKEAKKKMKDRVYSELYELISKSRKNDKVALRKLADKYYYGDIVERNVPVALELMSRAAEKNDQQASMFLADYYIDSGDNDKGKFYLLKAAKLGDKRAKNTLKRMEDN